MKKIILLAASALMIIIIAGWSTSDSPPVPKKINFVIQNDTGLPYFVVPVNHTKIKTDDPGCHVTPDQKRLKCTVGAASKPAIIGFNFRALPGAGPTVQLDPNGILIGNNDNSANVQARLGNSEIEQANGQTTTTIVLFNGNTNKK